MNKKLTKKNLLLMALLLFMAIKIVISCTFFMSLDDVLKQETAQVTLADPSATMT